MTYCFDLDNTICETNGNDYDSCKPITTRIEKINSLYDSGETIIIFTARGMTKYNGNLELINQNLFEKTQKQLEDWGVKYNKLVLGKPSYDFIIDDKNLLISNFFGQEKRKVGFVAGCFDILHPGYIELFEEAKKNCDHLIVGLQKDPTLERPHKMKPILSLGDRIKILSSIKFIDEIHTYQTESDLVNLMDSQNIDIRFLGDDYIGVQYTGYHLGIPIKFINRNHGWSSTEFKIKIKNSFIL